MVNSCIDSDMVKHLADHTETIANMDELHTFENFVKLQDQSLPQAMHIQIIQV